MSRPAKRTASYGFVPYTGVVVDFWKKSGTISSKPPQTTTSKVRTISRPTLFSICSCLSIVIPPESSVMTSRSDHRHFLGAAACDGLEHVVGHDQHTAEEQDTTQPTNRPERIGTLDAFNESIGQGAVSVHSTPHQTLHHTGNPHRCDVQNGANGCDPEVSRHQLRAVHLGFTEQTRQQIVDRADRNHRHPTKSTRVHVTNGPV